MSEEAHEPDKYGAGQEEDANLSVDWRNQESKAGKQSPIALGGEW